MSGRRVAGVLLLGLVLYLAVSMSPNLAGRAAAPAAVSSSSVLGRPSLSADFINRVLVAYSSPAQGLGQALYQESVTFGIDDAVALAFFLHESTMGRYGSAAVTHSLGNIVCAGFPRCSGRFRWYATWQEGFSDWFHLLSTEYVPHGLTTIEKIIPVYAPASENNVAAYIAAVKASVSAWRAGRVVV